MFHAVGKKQDFEVLKRTLSILKKTNPEMHRAIKAALKRNQGLDGLGDGWGDLFTNAGSLVDTVIKTGGTYAQAQATAKLNQQAANNAAKLASQQIAQSIKEQSMMDQYATSRSPALSTTDSTAQNIKRSVMEIPGWAIASLLLLTSGLGYSIYTRKTAPKAKGRR
jgi:hypothetical protein